MQLRSPSWKKYKKYHKQQLTSTPKTIQLGGPVPGSYRIISLEPARIASRHFEMIKKTIRKVLKKSGKIWIAGFPHLPVTAKPLEIRMGKGKGAVDYWAMPMPAGSTLVELDGVSTQQGFKALMAVQKKLPVRSKVLASVD